MSDERESPQESDEQQADSRSAAQDADTLKAVSELVEVANRGRAACIKAEKQVA